LEALRENEMKRYIATVHILVKARDESDACDVIAETMRSLTRDEESWFVDWEYTCVGEHLLSPAETSTITFEE